MMEVSKWFMAYNTVSHDFIERVPNGYQLPREYPFIPSLHFHVLLDVATASISSLIQIIMLHLLIWVTACGLKTGQLANHVF